MAWTIAAIIVLAAWAAVTTTLWRRIPATAAPPAPWPEVTRRRVIVSLGDVDPFRGVLWDVNPEFLVLRDAELLTDDRAVPVDGEVIVERRRVAYVQVLP